MKFFVATAIVTALCVGVWRAQNTSNFPAIGHIDRYDAALDSLIASDAKIEVLCGGFEWAEGPVWVPESGNKFGGYVLFSDIPHNAEDSHREIDFCGVYRLQKDGTVTVQRRDISRPNGIAFSPDEKTMYVANSDGQDPVWCAFPVQDDGNPGTPTVFFDSSKDSRIPKGGGDGLKVDADGNVFATGVALAQVAQPAVSSFREKTRSP